MKWGRMYEKLCSYKKKYGHCNVPKREFKELGQWVQQQRNCRKGYGTISQQRIDRLDEIDFVWDEYQAKWDKMYNELCEFKKKHGHCNVSEKCPADRKLGMWVRSQREYKRDDKISQNRIHRMEQIGFEWEPGNVKWEQKYAQLCAFQKKYGHCNVPHSKTPEEFKGLLAWVKMQRTAKNWRKSISQSRVDRLESIGFRWEGSKEAAWNERFDELQEFRQEHGHCNVPTVYKRRKKLNGFVNSQRQLYREGKLGSDRIAKLESVGFNWIGIRKTKSQKLPREEQKKSVRLLDNRAQQQSDESLDRLVDESSTKEPRHRTKKRSRSVVHDGEEIEPNGVRRRKSRRVDKDDDECSQSVVEQEYPNGTRVRKVSIARLPSSSLGTHDTYLTPLFTFPPFCFSSLKQVAGGMARSLLLMARTTLYFMKMETMRGYLKQT